MNNSTLSKITILFLFFVSFAGLSAHSQVNDECINAVELNVGTTCNYLQYTTFGATASQGAPAPGCASYQGGDVWFKAVIPANGTLELNSNIGDII
jgi:hypothetical protein